MTPVTDQLLEKITTRIVQAIQPEKIVLFGSHAKGTARPDSDLDLLIIENKPFGPQHSRRQEMSRVWRLLSDIAVSKDIVVYSQDEVEYWKESENHLIGHALREGRTLYARS